MPKIGQTVNTVQPFWQTDDNKTCCLYHGDLHNVLPIMNANSFDSIVTDPPYELDFMGKHWDSTGIAFQVSTWEKVLRVLKPGGYMLCFGGTRTYHRLTCAVEDAGFEIRDCLMWMYGTGFPKGQGCLKPAYEPIILARKPGKKVLTLGIDECRIPLTKFDTEEYIPNRVGYKDGINYRQPMTGKGGKVYGNGEGFTKGFTEPNQVIKPEGRYPANVTHDGSEEVLEEFEKFGESKSVSSMRGVGLTSSPVYGAGQLDYDTYRGHNDSGSVARFFYCAKATKEERGEAREHPTVKPLELMKWCVRLVTPEGGRVLDCFAGSSMTGVAAMSEGRLCALVEKELPYAEAGKRKLEKVSRLLLPQKRVNVLDKRK